MHKEVNKKDKLAKKKRKINWKIFRSVSYLFLVYFNVILGWKLNFIVCRLSFANPCGYARYLDRSFRPFFHEVSMQFIISNKHYNFSVRSECLHA